MQSATVSVLKHNLIKPIRNAPENTTEAGRNPHVSGLVGRLPTPTTVVRVPDKARANSPEEDRGGGIKVATPTHPVQRRGWGDPGSYTNTSCLTFVFVTSGWPAGRVQKLLRGFRSTTKQNTARNRLAFLNVRFERADADREEKGTSEKVLGGVTFGG
uniref:Uncharacterized protein n=1 Tax=Timema genevievae TaxID=629358 RepID=A0A7R9PPL0_TIMGE|nr:unnamed protein product [Timema genevievae]